MTDQNINNDSIQAESINVKNVFNDLIEEIKEEAQSPELNFIFDIPVSLSVELGRTTIPIKNLLKLTQGSVIELDGIVGQPLGILINDRLIANGEVFVVNNKYSIRLTEIINPTDRIQKLNR
ncbi:MAG: flagellar motor switch protein FliN [Methylococcaceae bacterium]|jgi:flagellar motor switch protein FliN